jgi:hypothetical protein
MSKVKLLNNNFYVVILLLINISALKAQNKLKLEEKVATDVCDCLGQYEIKQSEQAFKTYLDTCLIRAVNKNKKAIDEMVKLDKSSKTEYQKGQEFFIYKVAPILYNKCEYILELKRR